MTGGSWSWLWRCHHCLCNLPTCRPARCASTIDADALAAPRHWLPPLQILLHPEDCWPWNPGLARQQPLLLLRSAIVQVEVAAVLQLLLQATAAFAGGASPPWPPKSRMYEIRPKPAQDCKAEDGPPWKQGRDAGVLEPWAVCASWWMFMPSYKYTPSYKIKSWSSSCRPGHFSLQLTFQPSANPVAQPAAPLLQDVRQSKHVSSSYNPL